MTDHTIGLCAIVLAGLCGVLPFILTTALNLWGPL
jgi:hypothetical protein